MATIHDRVVELQNNNQVLRVACNGLEFPVLLWGPEDGRAIMLLHGFPQHASIWNDVASWLAEDGFRVFAPVQRGYDISTRPNRPDEYSFQHFAADALAIADALGVSEFDLVGNGAGGALAWMIAATQPHRVRSLTSLRFPHPAAFANGVQTDPRQRTAWIKVQTQLGDGGPVERAARLLAHGAAGLTQFLHQSGMPESYLQRYVQRLKEPGALVGALFWEYAVYLDDFARVPAIRVPTLLLWNEGPAVHVTSVHATREHVRAAYAVRRIPHTGNWILETHSRTVLPVLRAHLVQQATTPRISAPRRSKST